MTGEDPSAPDDPPSAGDADRSADGQLDWVPRDPSWPVISTEDRAAVAGAADAMDADLFALPAVALVVAAFAIQMDLLAVATGAVVIALWAWSTPMYVGTAGALFGGATGVDGLAAGLLAVGVLWLFLVPVMRTGTAVSAFALWAVAGLLFGVVVGTGLWIGTPLLAAVGLAIAVGIGLYAVRRYGLVRVTYRDTV